MGSCRIGFGKWILWNPPAQLAKPMIFLANLLPDWTGVPADRYRPTNVLDGRTFSYTRKRLQILEFR
jgi:hypothetical protein